MKESEIVILADRKKSTASKIESTASLINT